MGHLLNYALTSSIYLAIGFLCYRFALSGARQHAFNRIALHAIVLLSLILPLIHFSWTYGTPAPSVATQTTANIGFELIPGGIVEQEQPVWPEIMLLIYLAGCAAVLVRILVSLLHIRRLISKGERINVEIRGISAILTITEDTRTAPFSWIRNIVIGRRDFDEDGEAILVHEAGHIRHGHSLDMMAYMLLLVFQWFNPAAWLMVDELRSVHEFQADSDVMESGVDMRQYQMMLIKKAVGSRFPSPANSLNHSNLKNRITMMYKSRSSAARKAAALLVVPAMALAASVTHIPAVASVLSAASSATLLEKPGPSDSDGKVSKNLPDTKTIAPEIQSETAPTHVLEAVEASAANVQDANQLTEPEEPSEAAKPKGDVRDDLPWEETTMAEPRDIFVAVEKNAEYPGGFNELMRYLANNIRYPKEAHDNNVQGRVIVKFVIEKDGKVTDPEIVRGVSPELNAEALRVINSMPAWEPGENNGKPVASYFTLPITFRLQDNSPKEPEEDNEMPVTIVAPK